MISPHPATQQAPIPRATTAACDVRPPRTVNIPCAAAIPSISSGVVSRRTRTTLSPFPPFPSSFASSAVNTTFVSLSTIANFPSAYGASAGIVHLIVAPYSSFVVGRTKLVPDA